VDYEMLRGEIIEILALARANVHGGYGEWEDISFEDFWANEIIKTIARANHESVTGQEIAESVKPIKPAKKPIKPAKPVGPAKWVFEYKSLDSNESEFTLLDPEDMTRRWNITRWGPHGRISKMEELKDDN
jgi:hypothetical protein